jgi:antitoxin (DNA-binding transcriptional repressor) of toxin-antitoxin stability system
MLIRWPTVSCLLLALIGVARATEQFTLARGGKPVIRIVVAEAAHPSVRETASELALERFIRFSYAIRDTNMAHWQGIKSVTTGANTVDLQAPPSWLPEDERQAFATLTAEARADKLREWSTITPALLEGVREAARKAAAAMR